MNNTRKKITSFFSACFIITIVTTVISPIEILTAKKASAQSCSQRNSVMLVMDRSSSMKSSFPGFSSRERALSTYTEQFLNTINYSEDKVGMTSFSSTSELLAPLGSRRENLLSKLYSSNTRPGTRIDRGLETGFNNLKTDSSSNTKYVILITDGRQNGRGATNENYVVVNSVANQIKSSGSKLVTLGLGDQVDYNQLNRISSPGYSFYATDKNALERFFNILKGEINDCDPISELPTDPLDPGVPQFDSFQLECDAGNAGNPYTYAMSMELYASRDATIETATVTILPAGSTPPKLARGGDSPESLMVSFSGGTTLSGATLQSSTTKGYKLANIEVPYGQSAGIMSFSVDFLNATNFVTQFSDGIDLYIYIADSLGRSNTNQGDTLEKVVSRYTFDSYETCAHVYYSTGNGDFRSVEPGAYQNLSSIGSNIVYNIEGNKYWQTQNSAFSIYKAFDNGGQATTLPYTADFTFEARSAITPRSTRNSANNFNQNLTGTTPILQLKRDVLKQLHNSITVALDNYDVFDVYSITPDRSNYPGKVGYNTSGKEISIDLKDIKNKDAIVVIDHNSYENVTIYESTGGSENKIIIWCKTKSCNLKVNSSATTAGTSISTERKFLYNKSSIQASLASKKIRMYFNYSPEDRSASTPIDNEFTVNGKNIPSTRKIELIERKTDEANIYLGAFAVDGFIVTSKSQKTDVIKGLTLSRGMIANAAGGRTQNLYFKDFPKPFSFMDYDPRYSVEFYNKLNIVDAHSSSGYVGL